MCSAKTNLRKMLITKISHYTRIEDRFLVSFKCMQEALPVTELSLLFPFLLVLSLFFLLCFLVAFLGFLPFLWVPLYVALCHLYGRFLPFLSLSCRRYTMEH